MDWPFETFLPSPILPPRRVSGVAEIVGRRNGAWQIGNIYLLEHGVRIAGYDERREIEMRLQTMAGGDIGRAYRRSMEGLCHDND